MLNLSKALLAGSLAFGLTAAAATGTAFTISSVQNVPGTDFAVENLATTSCSGTYEIAWTIDQDGYLTGFNATRTGPDPDPNAQFCSEVPAYIEISRDGTIIDSEFGTTDSDGDFAGLLDGTVIGDEGDSVRLEIGPNAGFLISD